MLNEHSNRKLNEAIKNNSLEDILFHLPAIQEFSLLVNYIKSKPSKNTTHIHNCRVIFLELLKLMETSQKISLGLKNEVYNIVNIIYNDLCFSTLNKRTTEINKEQIEILKQTTEFLLKGFKERKLEVYEQRPDFLFYFLTITLNKEHLEEVISLYNKNSFELYEQNDIDINNCITSVFPLLFLVNEDKYNFFANSIYNIPYVKKCILQTKDKYKVSKKIHKLFLFEKLKNNIKTF